MSPKAILRNDPTGDVHRTYYAPGSEITVPWLGPRPAPESRTFHEGATNLSAGAGDASPETDQPFSGCGHSSRERWAHSCSWRPAGPVHTCPLCQEPAGETVSALRCTELLPASLSRCCPQGTFSEAFQGQPRAVLHAFTAGHQTFPRVSFQLLLQ